MNNQIYDENQKNSLLIFSFSKRSELYSHYYKFENGLTMKEFETVVLNLLKDTEHMLTENEIKTGYDLMNFIALQLTNRHFKSSQIQPISLLCKLADCAKFDQINETQSNLLIMDIETHENAGNKKYDFYEVLVTHETHLDEPYRLLFGIENDYIKVKQSVLQFYTESNKKYSNVVDIYSALKNHLHKTNFVTISFHELIFESGRKLEKVFNKIDEDKSIKNHPNYIDDPFYVSKNTKVNPNFEDDIPF